MESAYARTVDSGRLRPGRAALRTVVGAVVAGLLLQPGLAASAASTGPLAESSATSPALSRPASAATQSVDRSAAAVAPDRPLRGAVTIDITVLAAPAARAHIDSLIASTRAKGGPSTTAGTSAAAVKAAKAAAAKKAVDAKLQEALAALATVDAAAAGWGWARAGVAGGLDLVPALAYELGHILGLGHDLTGLMAATIRPAGSTASTSGASHTAVGDLRITLGTARRASRAWGEAGAAGGTAAARVGAPSSAAVPWPGFSLSGAGRGNGGLLAWWLLLPVWVNRRPRLVV